MLRSTLHRWLPETAPVTRQEKLRAAGGALLGIMLTGLLCQWWIESRELQGVWLVAPMGASAVLLFALPSSPLAQPWPVIGGNTVSALVGIALAHVAPQTPWAGGLAVALAIGLMFALRCLHPPGGAMALLGVLTHTVDFGFAFNPVLLNGVLIVLAAMLYNSLTGRPYPHRHSAAQATPPDSGGLSSSDLDAALRKYNQVLDMDRQDLQDLLREAQTHAYQRTLGQLRCSDIMTRSLVTARQSESLDTAWQRLIEHEIKALPVVDEAGHVLGIVSRSDFIRHWHGADGQPSSRPSEPGQSPEVQQIMTHKVRVAPEDQRLIDLLPLFSNEGHHHLPIVNDRQLLVGMITESDVVRALHRAVR